MFQEEGSIAQARAHRMERLERCWFIWHAGFAVAFAGGRVVSHPASLLSDTQVAGYRPRHIHLGVVNMPISRSLVWSSPLVLILLLLTTARLDATCYDGEGHRIPCNSNLIAPLQLVDGDRVLLLGNSFMQYGAGLRPYLEQLAADDGLSVTIEVRAEGGWTWADQLDQVDGTGRTLDEVLELGWDVVVLQDYSTRPINDPASHDSDADLLVGKVRSLAGAEPLFFMTWAYRDRDAVMTQPLCDRYTEDGLRHEANVSPVGLAFQRVVESRPDIELYADAKHPSEAGNFLAAASLYRSLTGTDLTNLGYGPTGLTGEQAAALRASAETIVASYLVTPTVIEKPKSEVIDDMFDAGFNPYASGPSVPGFAKAYGHLLYLPPSYHASEHKIWPLIIVIEGRGELGDGEEELHRIYKHSYAQIISGNDGKWPEGKHYHDAIICTPQFSDGNKGSDLIESFIAYLKVAYRVDPHRIAVTGLSDGGALVAQFTNDKSDLLAAAVPAAAAGGIADGGNLVDGSGRLKTSVWSFHNHRDGSSSSPFTVATNTVRRVAAAWKGLSETAVEPLDNIPDPFDDHYTADITAPTAGGYWKWEMFNKTSDLTVPVPGDLAHPDNRLLCTIYDAGGHNAWARTWREDLVYHWMIAQHKPHAEPYGSYANGTPMAVEQRQCENYDQGGPGLAYSDLSPGNSGGVYRDDDVDLAGTSDVDGGHDVIDTAVGEYLQYTTRFVRSGDYRFQLRASATSAATVAVEIDGSQVATIDLAGSGWETVESGILTIEGGIRQVVLKPQAAGLRLNWFAFPAEGYEIPTIELVTDNEDSSVSQVGGWNESTGAPGFWGANYAYSAVKGRTGNQFIFRPDPVAFVDDWYEVFIRHPAKSDRAIVPVDVVHDDGVAVLSVDMTVDGGQWKSLGVYQFSEAFDPRVVVRSDGATKWVQADAVMFRSTSAPGGSGGGSVVTPPDLDTVEVIVDNTDILNIRANGFWDIRYDLGGSYGGNALEAVAAGATLTYAADLPTTGMYEVQAWYPSDAAHAVSELSIEHVDGTALVDLDQTVDGGYWSTIGFYDFEAGTPAVLTLTAATTGATIADAFRFLGRSSLPGRDIIVDNMDAAQTTQVGSWSTSTSQPGYFGSNYHWAAPVNGAHSFSFVPALASGGSFKVSIRYPANSGRATEAQVTVDHANGDHEFVLDQTAQHDQWVEMGVFAFDAAAGHGLTLTSSVTGYTIADAVRFEETDEALTPPQVELRELIIDNDDPARVAVTGPWGTGSSSNPKVGSDYRWMGPNDTGSIVYDPAFTASGVFDIYISYNPASSREQAVPVTVVTDTGPVQVDVDMRQSPDASNPANPWFLLGQFNLPASGATVTTSVIEAATGYTIGDAIRFVEVESGGG